MMKWFNRHREEISVDTAPIDLGQAEVAASNAAKNLNAAVQMDARVEAITDKLESLRIKNHFAERIQKAMKGTQ